MEKDRMEKILYKAQEKLPTTNMEWKISNLTKKKTNKKMFYRNKIVAASLAFVLFLGIGSVTVLANMEMNIDTLDYGQWVDYLNCGGWKKCEKLMKKRGFVVPMSFENYEFTACDTWLVAKHGDTYWDVLTKNVYNPIAISYNLVSENRIYDESMISVDVGTLDEVYWSSYYGYEKVDGVWKQVDSDETFEYDNCMIYGKTVSYTLLGETMNWSWIDEKNDICWYVTVPKDAGIDIVKTIIDLN